MKRKPVKFLVRLVLFCLVLVVIDRILGFTFHKVYFSQKVGQFSETTYAVDSSKQDILIFGSSRATRHYSSSIISKGVGLSCYNSGRDGQAIPYAAAIEEVSLNRHKPKLVILDITPKELAESQSKYEKLTVLLPYCDEHPELIKYISEISKYERYKLFSKTYPYNSSVFILATNALFPNSVKKDDHGYSPLEGKMTRPEMEDYFTGMKARSVKIHEKKETPEAKGIHYFEEFLNRTLKYHIKTMVVISPTILKDPFYLDNQTVEKQLIISIARKYPNVTFLDYSSNPNFNYHPEKFSDVFHLNRKGSTEYSDMITAYIRAHYSF